MLTRTMKGMQMLLLLQMSPARSFTRILIKQTINHRLQQAIMAPCS